MKISNRQFALYLFLILGILLYSCNMPGVTPTQVPTEAPVQDQVQLAGPAEGTLMAWVDGSTLAYIDFCKISTSGDCEVPDFMWIYRSEVTNYQFSLCVEAGTCMLPYIDAPSPDLIDPQQANSPVQIIGPEDKQAYCAWAGGRFPTEAEATAFEGAQLSHPVSGQPLTMSNDSSTTGGESLTGILIGLLTPGTENGIRCIVDSPAPMAAACETSAFYLNGASPETDHTVTEAGRFCQKGQGFVTLDFDIPDGGNLQSVNGDCEVVGDHRILCSNQSVPNGGGEALILINGPLPAVQGNGIPAAGQMQCLPGYEVNAESPAGCSFGELVPAVRKDSGLAAAQFQTIQDQLADQVSLVVYQSNSMLSTNLDLTCPQPLSFSERLGRCVFEIPVEDLARAGRNTGGATGLWNPLTGYPPPNPDGTCPEGSTLLNGLYCIPNEDRRVPLGFGGFSWDPLGGYPPRNADGTCPEGSTLFLDLYCIPNPPDAPLSHLRVDFWNAIGGYPPPNADGTCPEGASLLTLLLGLCIPSEPPPGEDQGVLPGLAVSWDAIGGYPPPNADGTCPEGASLLTLLLGLCIPSEPAPSEDEGGPLDFELNWDPLGGFPLPDGYGGCPEGSALINGHCIPSEPPPGGSGGLTGSGFWNPLTGYPSSTADGICPHGSTLFNGHCLPSEPPPSGDSRCMLGYWFSETLGVCLPDITLGCPVGTYFDKAEGLCIASGEPTSFTLAGFHFDEASQCSLTDLPSGRYPGCPAGQAFDPSTGSCDFENTWLEEGKRLYAVEFDFSAPSCEVKDNSGDTGGVPVSCGSITSDSICNATPGCAFDYPSKSCK